MTNTKHAQADSTLVLVKEEPTSEDSGFPFSPPCLDVPDANIIIRSSDQVKFRVHKSLLSMSSPFFNDLLSLPQPPDGELVDGLPVVQLSEDADLLNSLVSLLYPISPYIPNSYEHTFALLAACQKYDMVSIQSYIRGEIKRWAPTSTGVEAFRKYAIASSLGLNPEMESAARLTLGYPMTFESLGDGLRSFKGRALLHRDDEYERRQANSTLALVREEPTSENSDPSFGPLCLNLPDASLIVRSSDQVNFRVHKSLLAVSSPFFEDLLSLPQPPDDELIDGLPVIQLSEDAGLLNSLISLLYPIAPVIPSSYEKVFALLAACQKYDMESVQSNIRAEIKRGTFPAPAGAESFRAYAIASSMELIPEMESTARLTLGYPMTFECLGEQLRSLKGRELCNLVRYRRRCRDDLVSCLDSFFDVHSRCQIWASCREWSSWSTPRTTPTPWLRSFFTSKVVELKKGFTHAVFSPSTILEGFMVALKNHTHSGCNACARVHLEEQTFYRELDDVLAQALDKVNTLSATELDSS
ncbi:hypothetical protein EDB85DRAFT_1872096 [Lactarius pseudohatsudake]|nr:hypothetical protein EDB85DRAFT_1872096 [Lactarius pseudohatsudake]